jgi:hypothetical protein
MGIPLPRKGEFEEVIMVEVLIEEMFGSDCETDVCGAWIASGPAAPSSALHGLE